MNLNSAPETLWQFPILLNFANYYKNPEDLRSTTCLTRALVQLFGTPIFNVSSKVLEMVSVKSSVSDHTHSCSAKMVAQEAPKLQFIDPEEVLSIEAAIAQDHEKEVEIIPGIGGLLNISDKPLENFRDSYSRFCFEKNVLFRSRFGSGRPILEAGSGNNDLGYFGSLRNFLPPIWGNNSYLLSNYSGGRGDYFALLQLVAVHNEELKLFGETRLSYEVENSCMTVGGQGAISITASFFKKNFPGASVVLSDATYCNNYSPFCQHGVPLRFVKTPTSSALPKVEDVIEELSHSDARAWMYVKFHNPSGENYSTEELRQIVQVLKERDQYLIYPEAYEALQHGNSARSPFLDIITVCADLQYSKLIRIKTIAKEFGLAGLRAGYLLAPKEIARHGYDLNALQHFNPAMTNAAILVACAYLRYRSFGGTALSDIEGYLKTGFAEMHDCHSILDDFSLQNDELRGNWQFVFRCLFGPHVDFTSNRWVEDEKTLAVIPKGGITIYVKFKEFEGADQKLVFRRIYLMTGLILHPGEYLGHKPGFWTRITFSHDRSRLAECMRAISFIRDNVVFLHGRGIDGSKMRTPTGATPEFLRAAN